MMPCCDFALDRRKNDAPDFVRNSYALAFEDTFGGPTVDFSKWDSSFLWGPDLTINNEEQYYVDVENGLVTSGGITMPNPFSFNAAGNLVITAAPITGQKPVTNQGLDGGQNYSSGILTTRDALCFTYGYVEVCCKLPCGVDGSWIATWLLNCFYYNNASEKAISENIANPNEHFNPEIDFLEHVNGINNTDDCATQAYHYFSGDRQSTTNYRRWSLDGGGFRSYNINTQAVDSNFNIYQDCDNANQFTMPYVCDPSYCDEFHTFGVDWQEGHIHFYIDGQIVNCINGADNIISDQSMYFILNFAVGGGYPFPNGQLAKVSDYPAEFVVEYVRIYTP